MSTLQFSCNLNTMFRNKTHTEISVLDDQSKVLRVLFKIGIFPFKGARSFAINSLAINSLAISLTCYPLTCYQFTCYLFHLLSASLALRPHLLLPHLLSNLTCYQVNLLSGLTCYQNVCSPVSTAINAHLLSKTSYYPNTLLSKLVVFLNKLLSKPVLSCYHKLVAF